MEYELTFDFDEHTLTDGTTVNLYGKATLTAVVSDEGNVSDIEVASIEMEGREPGSLIEIDDRHPLWRVAMAVIDASNSRIEQRFFDLAEEYSGPFERDDQQWSADYRAACGY